MSSSHTSTLSNNTMLATPHRVNVTPAGPGHHDKPTEHLQQETALEVVHYTKATSPTTTTGMSCELQDEGEREREALATVFGVQEYTESVMFWKRLHEEKNYQKNNNSKPIKKKKGTTLTSQQSHHHQASPSIMVQEEENTTTASDNCNSNNQELLSLPDIPTVSKFNDLLIDDEHGVDFLFPANPSSVLLHSFSPANTEAHSVAESSVHSSSIHFMASAVTAGAAITADDTGTSNNTIAPPRLFIGYPPSIFDMLKSDHDERIIVWGPSDRTTATASSSASGNLHSQPASSLHHHDTTAPASSSPSNKKQPPYVQGFSTNTTSSSASLATGNNNKKRSSKLVNSARMSAQSLLVDSFHRLSRQKSLPARIRPRSSKQQLKAEQQGTSSSLSPPPLLKRASFTIKNRHSAEELHPPPIPVDPQVQQQQLQQIIIAASVEKLVEKLTNSLDYTFMTDFFLTYRTFISATQLCKLLILRFRWALENDHDDRRVVRVRTFVVMRHWLLNYFEHDFQHCRELRQVLTSFLNSLAHHPLVRRSARDQRIVKGLKRVVRRLKYIHYEQHGCVDHESGFRTNTTANGDTSMMDRSSVLGGGNDDDDGSLESDVTPGNSEAGDDLDTRLMTIVIGDNEAGLVDPTWNEEQAMARLQYERRRREEEEERSRVEFFSSRTTPTSDGVSVPSLHSDVVSSCASTSEPTTPMESIDGRINTQHLSNGMKRPALPCDFNTSPLQQQQQQNIISPSSPKMPAVGASGSRRLPATIIHDISVEPQDLIEKTVRRIPSNRWCKASPDEEAPVFNKQQFELENRQTSPQQRKHSNSVSSPSTPNEITEGLARRLSRKSIERRKSEKNLRETQSSASSAASSVVSTPHMSSSASAPADASDIPEMPPLPAAALNTKLLVTKTALASFEALPYDMTATPSSTSPTAADTKNNKRRLPKKFSKIFNSKQASNTDKPLPSVPPSKPTSTSGANSSTSESTKTSLSSSSSSSSSSSDTPTAQATTTTVTPSKSSSGPTPLLSQLAAELRDEDDHDDTDTLRRPSLDGQSRYTRRRGPIYLSHLQPTGFESETAVYIEEAEESDNDDGQSIRTFTTNTAAAGVNLNRGLSLLSNAPNHIRTLSLIVEPADDRHASSSDEADIQQRPVSPLDTAPSAAIASSSTSTTMINNSKPATISTLPSSSSSKHSFILSYHSTKIVEQFCLIERQVLFGVQWEELVDCQWRDGIAPSGGVQRLIQRFNDVCQWVSSEIVRTDTVDGRAEIIRKFIRLAQKCKTYANFATLLQILLGLQSPAVTRLSATWARVSASDMRLLDQLIEFTSPMKNWKNMRDSMALVAEEYGNQTSTTHHDNTNTMGGCIPFLGIYLSDLIFNAELPPYIEPSRRKNSCDSLVLQQPLVNFHKHRITATVIKRVLTFQNLARRYPFTPDPELYRLCLDIPSIDLDTIRKMSFDIEP